MHWVQHFQNHLVLLDLRGRNLKSCRNQRGRKMRRYPKRYNEDSCRFRGCCRVEISAVFYNASAHLDKTNLWLQVKTSKHKRDLLAWSTAFLTLVESQVHLDAWSDRTLSSCPWVGRVTKFPTDSQISYRNTRKWSSFLKGESFCDLFSRFCLNNISPWSPIRSKGRKSERASNIQPSFLLKIISPCPPSPLPTK